MPVKIPRKQSVWKFSLKIVLDEFKCKHAWQSEISREANKLSFIKQIILTSTGCFTINETKVFVYFSGYDATSDLRTPPPDTCGVDGGLDGGSSMRRPGSEDRHQGQSKLPEIFELIN
jgi:hypothetical protein